MRATSVRRRGRAAVVAALIGALLVAALDGTVLAGPQRSRLSLVAEFTDAGPLVPGNYVTVDGVRAGYVKQVKLVKGRARVSFSVGGNFTPVHSNATIRLRPLNLLGEQYMELDRGGPPAPALGQRGVIPPTQARRGVELQEVLDTVDQPTGAALAALIVGLGEGMAERGDDTAAAIDALRPALEQADTLLEILKGQNRVLQSVIDRTEPLTSALAAGEGQRLDALVGEVGKTLGAVAAARPELEGGLRRLPAALDTVRAALAEARHLADETTPVLRSLRPLTGDLRGVADELGALSDAANPALESLNPVLERAQRLLDAAAPVAAELSAAGGDLERVARSGRTLVEALPPDLGTLLDAVRNVALASAERDGITHFLRVFVDTERRSFSAPPEMRSPVAGPPVPAPRSPDRAAPAPPPPPAPPALSAPGPTFPPVPRPPIDPGSATGLTFDQERNLLRYLMGVS